MVNKMCLVVDIGNTNVTFGVFKNDTLTEVFRCESNKNNNQDFYEQFLSENIKNYNVNSCIIASVADEITHIIKQTCDKVFQLDSFILNPDFDFKMDINVQNPNSVGIDRLINAFNAKRKFPLPLIVVDIGSATTFDIVSTKGDFIGGIIMPGLNMQIQALYSKTSKLPSINLEECKKAIGNSTENAILSGIVLGSASAISGLLKQCEAELGEKPTIIATGGLCKFMAEHLPNKFDYVEPNLTLEGLYQVLKNK